MLDNIYKSQNLNRQAFHALAKRVEIPGVELGVGDAEHHESIPMVHKISPKMNVVVGKIEQTPIEKMTIDGQGPIFSPDDFPKSGYYGNAIGGF